ncbi:hypothetical protein [Sphingomonas sp. LaA6.9]|uniref:hypothetical protein n=1 Tax=Sphingomonas sp. LaA6.9 TaxID=2919914 RepID=UPI001F4F2022|nr:hypothetical protein [Sphingomonas sp. LaA6.9]MCJ8158827.1 hypothetical protein [Sphingomonas sp. LaA6.9]
MTDQEREVMRAEFAERDKAALALIEQYLEADSTLITHKRCGGFVEEHVFTEIREGMLCGFPTSDTMRLHVSTHGSAIDICPSSVTHVDRCPVEALHMIAKPGTVDDFFDFITEAERVETHQMRDEVFHRIRSIVRDVTRQLGDGKHAAPHVELSEALSMLDDIAEAEADMRKAILPEQAA